MTTVVFSHALLHSKTTLNYAGHRLLNPRCLKYFTVKKIQEQLKYNKRFVKMMNNE